MFLAPDRQVPRARLAAILWDRSAEAQARLSLRQALHEISGAMGELAPELLTLDRETMTLNTALCWIDAAAMVTIPPCRPANSCAATWFRYAPASCSKGSMASAFPSDKNGC